VYQLWDFIVHVDHHLKELVATYGAWTYAILFFVVFAETGVVIMPLLPGDSLLFAAGVLCVPGESGVEPLNVWTLCVVLSIAAVLGDTVNYHVGYYLGPKVFRNPKSFWLNPKHLERTQEFFDRYGGKTIILARFMPIIRTMAPFVAGIGRMHYGRFLAYNVVGGVVWVFTFVLLGWFFSKQPIVEKNFSLVIIAIVVISVLPAVYEFLRHRFSRKTEASAASLPAGDR
jgi:membrane-associated protein